MANFSASEIALTGFRIIRQRPIVVAWWAAPHLVFIFALSILIVTVAGPHLMALQALQAEGPATTPEARAEALSAISGVLPLYAAMLPLILALYAVCFSAVNRAILRPADSAYGYLRLGADELRQGLLFLWAMVLGFAAEIALIVASVLVTLVVLLIAGLTKSGGAMAALGGAAAVIGVLVLVLAYIYVLVRLSLSSAMTFDVGEVRCLKSWPLTKGRFWPMFGAYLLATILNIIVLLLGAVVLAVIGLVAGGGLAMFNPHPDMSSPAAYFSLSRILSLVASAFLYALAMPILAGPPAAIYSALTRTPGAVPAPQAAPAP